MAGLRSRYHLIVITFCTIIFFSCKENEESIEKNLIVDFSLSKPNLDTVIKYVVNKYYNIENVKNYNRLQFILGRKTYQKNSVFSDTIVTNKLERASIIDVSFEKGSFCLDKYAYDFVRFKLKVKGSYCQYYYVYEFCPPHQMEVSSQNFKSIPLDTNWSLQIEKS